MVSRLDRLFILLDTGSNESVRVAAAKQLGEVQRVQPNDLNYLLDRIKEYSKKSLWDTRIAAGHAIASVLEHVGSWPPDAQSDQLDDSKIDEQCKIVLNQIDIDQIIRDFDLSKISSRCANLLSLNDSEDLESEQAGNSTTNVSQKAKQKAKRPSSKKMQDKAEEEQLLRQRRLINKELGISMVDSLNIGIKSTDIISNDDLQIDYESGNNSSKVNELDTSIQEDAGIIVRKTICNYEKTIEKICNYKSNMKLSCPKHNSDQPSDTSLNQEQWPLTNIANEYLDNLFNTSWEVRHGAAIALRDILRLQGKFAGRRKHLSNTTNDKLNKLWLIDAALKASVVLVLDKFGDFLFDQVVAPVRENVAQLISCCIVNLSESSACLIMKLLIDMLQSPNWETRHGGILGLKYSLNVVEKSITKKMLVECFDPIYKCLADPVDDVSAEAAAALVPVKDYMIDTIPDKTPKLIRFLWEHLTDLDELTSSTSNIVLLLASLITTSSAELKPEELLKSIPKLWPLLNHPSTSVRISVLKALITLVESQNSNCLHWMPEDHFTIAIRLIFQRVILENNEEASLYLEKIWNNLVKIDQSQSRTERINLLKFTSQYLNYWLCLTLQPLNVPIDRSNPMWLNIGPDGSPSTTKPDSDIYIGLYNSTADNVEHQKKTVLRCRILGTRLLGVLYGNLVDELDNSPETQHIRDALKYLGDMFVHYLSTKSANQRMISSWAIEAWSRQQAKLFQSKGEPFRVILPKNLVDKLSIAIQEVTLYYDELASNFTSLQQIARDFVAAINDAGIQIPVTTAPEKRAIYNLNQIQLLCDLNIETEVMATKSKKTHSNDNKSGRSKPNSDILSILCTKQINLKNSFKNTTISQKNLSISVSSSISYAMISWQLQTPEKINLFVEPLLDSIEYEVDECLQDRSIECLTCLLYSLIEDSNSKSDMIDSILDKLVAIINQKCLTSHQDQQSNTDPSETTMLRIVFLDNLQRRADSMKMPRRHSTMSNTSNLKRSLSTLVPPTELEASETSALCEPDIRARGARIVLSRLVTKLGPKFAEKTPKLCLRITSKLISSISSHLERNLKEIDDDDNNYNNRDLFEGLNLLACLVESLDSGFKDQLIEIYSHLVDLLSSNNPIVRHKATLCIGLISKLILVHVIDIFNQKIVPLLDGSNTVGRCGAIEAIAQIIEYFHLDWIGYINVFIIQVLRRISDQNDQVRLMATHCFGRLLSLMPLNLQKNINNDDKKTTMIKGDEEHFIEQLLNPKKLDHFRLPFELKAELRSYQQDGLNWLAFLNRFSLHGILCDEMGLGKTLMTISIIAADHFNCVSKMSSHGVNSNEPSIIVCPSTLTEHWLYELEKFLTEEVKTILNPVSYTGSLGDRMNLRARISTKQPNETSDVKLVVTSYDILRNDVDFFKEINWNYCVLDEGHIIKNVRTKLSRSIRLLSAKHRLILSGTPIQNNVTELWSLFDFLMPGFLGSERQFNVRYAKPILQSREVKCTSREQEAGALAMESLHRQVLPFILRRLKEDVLDDLPPKILQDYYCELSPLQQKLYEDFTHSKLCENVTKKSIETIAGNRQNESLSSTNSGPSAKSHVFQALQYLKNVCNHPKLVLTEKHSQYQEIKRNLDSEKSSLDDITHSSKLNALKQLLIDCDIGVINQFVETGDGRQSQPQITQDLSLQTTIVNQHRALIFCQLRSMVNIIENDLLKKHLPNITYLKLDGSVPTNQRQSIVSRFNDDPSIDVLLLTTQIGGLGLNLTGADTVIFVEHDWNPTKDLQAMDRAHRIGQKKVVNVYRLITKGTLEEKIMGLQKFKTMVSSTVINQDNSGLGTMNVDQLFDLFERDIFSRDNQVDKDQNKNDTKSSFLDLLPELWDSQQYETEYDLTNFVSSLKN